MKSIKKPWTKPTIKRLEPTEELLELFASKAATTKIPPVKHLK